MAGICGQIWEMHGKYLRFPTHFPTWVEDHYSSLRVTIYLTAVLLMNALLACKHVSLPGLSCLGRFGVVLFTCSDVGLNSATWDVQSVVYCRIIWTYFSSLLLYSLVFKMLFFFTNGTIMFSNKPLSLSHNTWIHTEIKCVKIMYYFNFFFIVIVLFCVGLSFKIPKIYTKFVVGVWKCIWVSIVLQSTAVWYIFTASLNIKKVCTYSTVLSAESINSCFIA